MFGHTSKEYRGIIIDVNPPLHYMIFANPIVKIPSPKKAIVRLIVFFAIYKYFLWIISIDIFKDIVWWHV